jgi:hypothetical protein
LLFLAFGWLEIVARSVFLIAARRMAAISPGEGPAPAPPFAAGEAQLRLIVGALARVVEEAEKDALPFEFALVGRKVRWA